MFALNHPPIGSAETTYQAVSPEAISALTTKTVDPGKERMVNGVRRWYSVKKIKLPSGDLYLYHNFRRVTMTRC